jgi:hypothetical protein
MSRSESRKKRSPRRQSLPRKRSEDKHLPINIEHFVDDKGNEGYRANLNGRRKAFLSKALSMKDKLELAKAYLAGNLDAKPHEKIYVARQNPKHNKLPKYLRYYKSGNSEGFRVVYLPLRKDRSFTDSEMSMRDKYDDAMDFLEDCMEERAKKEKKGGKRKGTRKGTRKN